MHLEAAPPRASALAPVPPAFDAVIARCLEKSPDRRWPSALALLEAARAALAGGPAAAPRVVPAVAVHVAVRPAGVADLEAVMAQADVGDAAEEALRGAGFAVTLATAGSLLGVRVLAEDPTAALAQRAEAVAWARALAAQLVQPGVEVSVSVHAADAAVRDTPDGPEIVGGPICETTAWLPQQRPGFLATPAVLAGLGG
jgi:serine/threonine-protein kinase